METESTVLPRSPPDVSPRVRRMILGLAAAVVISGTLGTALSPYLLVEHPLLLVGLNPDSRHLVLVANRVELWQALLVGSIRRGINFIGTFGLGSLYGYVLITWLEKKRPWVTKILAVVEKIYGRLGVGVVVLFPFYWIAALAGIARLPLRYFCLAIIPGQIVFVLAVLRFGEAIEMWTEPIIAFVTRYPFETTAVAVLLVGAQRAWSRFKRKDRDPAEPDLPL